MTKREVRKSTYGNGTKFQVFFLEVLPDGITESGWQTFFTEEMADEAIKEYLNELS